VNQRQAWIAERIQDLRNFLAHAQLFPEQLPPGQTPAAARERVERQIADLRQQYSEVA
jgi:hypothetical protein